MRWYDFTPLPYNTKCSYIESLRTRFAVSDENLASMFQIPVKKMQDYFEKANIVPRGKKPTQAQLDAWRSFVSVTPEVARRIKVYEKITDLREHGYSYNKISEIMGVSSNHCSTVYRVFRAVRDDNYDDFSTNNLLVGCKELMHIAADYFGKNYDEVVKKATDSFHTVYGVHESEDPAAKAPEVQEAAVAEPNPVPAPVEPEEVPDEHISVISPELLKSLNDNLTFFRALFSGGLKVPTA